MSTESTANNAPYFEFRNREPKRKRGRPKKTTKRGRPPKPNPKPRVRVVDVLKSVRKRGRPPKPKAPHLVEDDILLQNKDNSPTENRKLLRMDFESIKQLEPINEEEEEEEEEEISDVAEEEEQINEVEEEEEEKETAFEDDVEDVENDEDDDDVEDVEDYQDDVDVEDVEDDQDDVEDVGNYQDGFEDVEDVENDFTKNKEDELNATISSLQDGLKLEKEARMVLQIDMDVLQKKFQKLLEEDACLRTRIIKLQDDLKTATDSAKDEACKQIVDAVEHRLQGLFASEFAKVKEAFTGSSTDRVCCDKSSILEETTQRDQISVLQQALAAANQKLQDFKRVEDELRICRSDLHAAEEANKQKVDKIRRLEEGLKQAEARAAAAESRLELELSSMRKFMIKCDDAANEAVDKVANVKEHVWKDTFTSWRI